MNKNRIDNVANKIVDSAFRNVDKSGKEMMRIAKSILKKEKVKKINDQTKIMEISALLIKKIIERRKCKE